MYDQYYGLSGRPFQLTPDPHYYFESGTHRKALSYLGYGLAQGEGFIVITGEVGSGKSTLVSHLMQSIDKVRLTAATIVTSQLDALDLVQMAAESFGIDTRGLDKAATLKSIENFLHGVARAGRRCLLVVDEAQNLTPHEVKTIITRAGENTKIVFTGDVHQIDTPYLDEYSNGLAYLIQKIKNQPLFGHVKLEKGERSALANLANDWL